MEEMMKAYVKERTLAGAKYIFETHETIRKAAQFLGCSKSTVHNDVAKRLKRIDKSLYCSVQKILNQNFLEKHIRGGNSTKNKYKKLKKY